MAGVKQGRDGAVGILTLNEPESLNAMTPDLLGALAKAVAEMTADPAVRALVLTPTRELAAQVDRVVVADPIAERRLEPARLGSQLAYADKKGFRAALVAGETEFANNTVQVKDLRARTQSDHALDQLVAVVKNALREKTEKH